MEESTNNSIILTVNNTAVGYFVSLNPFYSYEIAGTVMCGISYSIDILAMVIIFKCRTKLKLIEHLILSMSQTLSLSYKFFSIFIIMALNFDKFIAGKFTCISIYPFTFSISLCYNCTWAYYSLYQYSSIKRTGHYLKLFNFTHNRRNFGLVAIGIVSFTIALVFSMFNVFRGDMLNETNDGKCGLLYKSRLTLALITFTSVPSFMVLVVYVVSIVSLIMEVKSTKNCLSKSDMNRYRKSFRVSVKFLCFSLLPFLSCCIRFGFVSLNYFCPTCKKCYYDLLQFIIIFMYMIEPALIIYVHNVLKRQFLNLFRQTKQHFLK